jgi:FixJ family two-component response regulator
LAAAGEDIPIIFITGHGDIAMSVQAMKAGAIEFFTKPFHDQDLLDAIHGGLKKRAGRSAGRQRLSMTSKSSTVR